MKKLSKGIVIVFLITLGFITSCPGPNDPSGPGDPYDPALPDLLYITVSLPAGTEGKFYSVDIGTAELPVGAEPVAISYALAAGKLPTGLSLSSTGLLSGTPASGSAGTKTFSVRAGAEGCNSKTAVFTLKILAAGDGADAINEMRISGNYDHSLYIDSQGNLWAWGGNDYGQLGNGTNTSKSTPVQIMAGTKFSAVAAGGMFSLAIDSNGNLWAWGINSSGELGDGTKTSHNSPIQIMTGTKFITVTAGYHSLAIDSGGNLWAWGLNYKGQLGDGTKTSKSTPVQIMAGTKFTTVTAGCSHSLAIDSSGNLWAWGENGGGQLGDGTKTSKSTPVQIMAGTKFSKIAAESGGYMMTTGGIITGESGHSLAIDSNGNLWAWGNNYNGQLGDGTTTQRLTPVQIKPGTKFAKISAGCSHNMAIDSSGELWIWGTYYFFDFLNGSSPVKVITKTKLIEIAAGKQHNLALDSNSNLRVWGVNEYGQLGNGTTTDILYPTWDGEWEYSEPIIHFKVRYPGLQYISVSGNFQGSRILFDMYVLVDAGKTSIPLSETCWGDAQIRNKPISGPGIYELTQEIYYQIDFVSLYTIDYNRKFTYTVSAHNTSYSTEYCGVYRTNNPDLPIHSFAVK